METQTELKLRRQNQTKISRQIYEHLPRNRSYALTPQTESSLGALGAAYVEAGWSLATNEDRKQFGEFLQRLGESIPGLFQQRPNDQKPVPKPWLDPVTNQPLPPPTDLKGKNLLRKYDPALADHYDAMERDPYGYVQSLREAEATRQALASIEYTHEQHRLNPFRSNDLTHQTELAKRDARLAEFYRREATHVEIPIFGKDKNMTVEGRLAKDPTTFAVVKIAQKIHEQWRAEDKLAAEEQRAQAEATLKRLETVAV